MPGTVLTVSSRALLDSCRRLGLDPEALVAAAGIAPDVLQDADARLPREKVSALWQRAYQVSGDADLALHAAEALRFGAYRVIDYLAASAPTVGVAVQQVSDYFPIINSVVRLPVRVGADEVRVEIVSPDDPEALSRPYVEYTFAAVFLRVREATGVRFPLSGVEFAFAEPASTAEHRRIFDCPVRFGAPQSALRLRRQDWDGASQRADPDLFGVLSDHARMLEGKVPKEPPEVTEVRRAIAAELKGGTAPTLDGVARKLGMSARTMQRRLQEHGVSYADLLDGTRAVTAMSYLSDRNVSCAEVAYLLGFAEQSSFNHAFKRWTGKAPSEYRRGA